MYYTYDEHIDRGQVILDNVDANADVAEALAEYGYDATRIAEGRGLLETAIATHTRYAQEYGEQLEATQQMNAARRAATVTLANFLKLTRRRLRDEPGLLSQLRASEAREKVYSEWVGQTRHFYEAALKNDTVLSALARYNVTRQKLRAGLDELEEVVQLNSVQEDEKADAVEAGAARRAAFGALSEWMDEFLDVSDVALHDKPGARKRFGENANV